MPYVRNALSIRPLLKLCTATTGTLTQSYIIRPSRGIPLDLPGYVKLLGVHKKTEKWRQRGRPQWPKWSSQRQRVCV